MSGKTDEGPRLPPTPPEWDAALARISELEAEVARLRAHLSALVIEALPYAAEDENYPSGLSEEIEHATSVLGIERADHR